MKYLKLERSSAILLDRPTHPFFDGLLHIYGPRLRSLFAHPEPDPAPNSARGRESRASSATGHLQPENSPTATAPAGSILLGDSLAILEELAGGLWHRQGFKLYWRWKSKTPVGRPKIDKEIRELIRKMSRENPLWGVPRIQAELRLLGLDLAESTVAKYRIRSSTSPSQTWKLFLANHAKQIAAIDFFTVPTLTFRNLYCFIILLHDRRQVIHFNVTAHPTAEWTARQLIEAFPEDSAPRHQRMVSSSQRRNFRYRQRKASSGQGNPGTLQIKEV